MQNIYIAASYRIDNWRPILFDVDFDVLYTRVFTWLDFVPIAYLDPIVAGWLHDHEPVA